MLILTNGFGDRSSVHVFHGLMYADWIVRLITPATLIECVYVYKFINNKLYASQILVAVYYLFIST